MASEEPIYWLLVHCRKENSIYENRMNSKREIPPPFRVIVSGS